MRCGAVDFQKCVRHEGGIDEGSVESTLRGAGGLGVEISGVIDSVAEGVVGFEPGQRVMASERRSSVDIPQDYLKNIPGGDVVYET